MDQKTVVITGANSGIGERIATNLAQMGMHLVLVCRSEEKAAAARDRIGGHTGNKSIDIASVDLASQSSVRACAEQLLSQAGRIDVLINNAGLQWPRRELTEDGIERVLATNVLGPHLLTQLLLPRLRESAPSRIVNIASSFAGELDLEDLQFEKRKYDVTRVYKQSKALNRLLTWELARRLDGSGVIANAVSPGLARTALYRGLSLPMRALMWTLQRAFGVTVEEAADTATWLASSDDPTAANGNGVWFEKRAAKPCEFADPQTERQAWERCEALIAPAQQSARAAGGVAP